MTPRRAPLSPPRHRYLPRLTIAVYDCCLQEIAWFDSQRTGDIITRLSSVSRVVRPQ